MVCLVTCSNCKHFPSLAPKFGASKESFIYAMNEDEIPSSCCIYFRCIKLSAYVRSVNLLDTFCKEWAGLSAVKVKVRKSLELYIGPISDHARRDALILRPTSLSPRSMLKREINFVIWFCKKHQLMLPQSKHCRFWTQTILSTAICH